MRNFKLFTDGACSYNPGPGAWAYIIKENDNIIYKECQFEPSTTNNRMEILAIIKGIQYIQLHCLDDKNEKCAITITSDSQYVLNGITQWMRGWKAKGWTRGKNQELKNVELWKQIDELIQTVDVTAEHVKGHSGHIENEECDRMAVRCIQDNKTT